MQGTPVRGTCSAPNVFGKIFPAGFCAEMNSAYQQGRGFSGKRWNLIRFWLPRAGTLQGSVFGLRKERKQARENPATKPKNSPWSVDALVGKDSRKGQRGHKGQTGQRMNFNPSSLLSHLSRPSPSKKSVKIRIIRTIRVLGELSAARDHRLRLTADC